ncbi:MAG TPA: amidohydrolase family protein [Myxococcota bacterium]|nr:amidohydrolase family protein [Myxococcota bacterium]
MAEQSRIVFQDANLVDGKRPARRGCSVVVSGARIERVAQGKIETRPGDRVIALGGRTLMPGMVQSHFHSSFGAFGDGISAPCLGLEAAPAYLSMLAAHNARTAIECGFTGAVGSSNAYSIDVALKEAILAGFVVGPRYLASGMELITTGEASDYANNRYWFMQLGNTGLSKQVDGPDAWRLAVRQECGRGVDVVKISASPGHGSSPARDVMYPTREELRAAVDTAHNLGKRVRAHCASRTAILECARAGVDVIDHADRMDRDCIDAIVKAGCFVTPSMLWTVRFLHIAENWDHAASRLPINEGFPETLEATLARIRGVRADFEHTCSVLPEAVAAGVKLLVGDDFGTPVMPHGDYGSELEIYVKQLGIPALDVIRWATIHGALLLGMGDELGSVEEGRLADLLVVQGDPLHDITCLKNPANVQAVLKGGVFVKDRLAA